MVKRLQVLIIYDSKTGNTEKMAFAVAEGAREVDGVDVLVKKVDNATNETLLESGRTHRRLTNLLWPDVQQNQSHVRRVSQDSRKARRQGRSSVHEFWRRCQWRRDHDHLDSRSNAGPRNDHSGTSTFWPLWCCRGWRA